MGTENAFIPFIRLMADRSDFAGSVNGNGVFYKTSTKTVIKLILVCFPKLQKKKKKGKEKNGFSRMKGSTCRNKTP